MGDSDAWWPAPGQAADDLSEEERELLAWARQNAGPDDHALMGQEEKLALARCKEWAVDKGASTTERIGTRERAVAIAKCVATYLADPSVSEEKHTEKAAISWAVEKFGVKDRTVRYAVAKHRYSYQLQGRSRFLVNGAETPFEPDLEAEPLLLPALPAEWVMQG